MEVQRCTGSRASTPSATGSTGMSKAPRGGETGATRGLRGQGLVRPRGASAEDNGCSAVPNRRHQRPASFTDQPGRASLLTAAGDRARNIPGHATVDAT